VAEGTRKIRKFAVGNVSLLWGIISIVGGARRGSGCGSRIRNRRNSTTGGQEDALGGLRSQRLRNSCPCTRERPNLAITRARGMYEWGNTWEGWEGGYGDICGDFFWIRYGRESVLGVDVQITVEST